jgi:hypothetical protein
MGIMMFITLEKPIRGLKDDLGGKGLAWCHIQLDAMAADLGLPDLSDFISASAEEQAELMAEAAEWTQELGEKPPKNLGPFKEEWFDAEEGLRTVNGLLAHLEANPAERQKLAEDGFPDLDEAVLCDLREAKRILMTARAKKVRFHFTCAY